MSALYEQAVKRTFVDSLRSVFLVDDAFPTFANMFESERRKKRFKESPRANRLYQAFRKRQLPCDIENTFRRNDIKTVERLRKCDLIVLDFHLDTDDSDNSKAIEILRRLADSKHFNTVVVYTKAPDLKEVWLDIAANLRPDLRLRGFLAGNDAERLWWEQVDPSALQTPSSEAIASFLTGDQGQARGQAIPDIRANGGEGNGNLAIMADAWIRSSIDKRRPGSIEKLDDEDTLGARVLNGRFENGKPLWLQCRGCFIAIVQKINDENEEEADQLLAKLDSALLDWKPNFIQLLVSEIQNKLELELLAADPAMFSDPDRQVGLSHYLLQELSGENDQLSTLERLTDRIVETVRNKIAGDNDLRRFADVLLTDIRNELGVQITTVNQLDNARALAHVARNVDRQKVVFLLNSFLSTERFSRSRLTTGTVFEKDGNYWVVTSPACDLTHREPAVAQIWMRGIHPVRAMLAAKLECVALAIALKNAAHGKYAFVHHGEKQLALRLLDGQTQSPAPEMFFTQDAGKVALRAGNPTFKASRVLRKNNSRVPSLSASTEFTVIGQLRANYASRALQLTGAHLARIGVDFFNFGEVGDGEAAGAAPAQ